MLFVFEPKDLKRSAAKNKTKNATHSTAKKAMLESTDKLPAESISDKFLKISRTIRRQTRLCTQLDILAT